ncbi:MAG: hypothetical protein ACREPC_11135 [Stenotrophomonas sp.]|uniref:hypothetical protein n=1 Tax=Stenotrophomonas sp. TaxID=69392 RepID=UPI003D6C885A
MTSRTRTLLPLVAAATALTLSACATAPGPEIPGTGQCHDGGLGWAVGKVADQPTMRRLLLESGTGLINPIGPETITSRDRRTDRLRVFIDKDNIITAARCE